MRPDFPFRPAALPFFYGWVVLGASTVGILMSLPGQTMGISVFTDHLISATALSRIEISNAYLLGTITSGLLLPYGGSLTDRLGVRRVVVAACVGLSATLVYLANADRLAAALADAWPEVPGSAVAWAGLAVGFTSVRFWGQGMLTLVSRTMIAHWFERRRGLVAAVSGPFVSFGFAAAPLLLSLWIARAGWRGAWLELAAVVGLGMGLIGWLLYRNSAEECGLPMDGRDATGELAEPAPAAPAELAERSRPRAERDFTRAEAIRTGAFWLLALGIGNQAMVGTGITFHIVDMGAEAGLAEAAAVSIFLPIALVSTGVGLLAGLAVDRYPIRFLMMVMMFGQCFMFLGMAHFGDPWLRVVAIGGWGLASGFYGPFTVAALPGFFGRAHIGAIQGFFMMTLVISSALGPSALALFEEAFGSYAPGLYFLTALPAAVFVASPFVRNPQRA